jgi:CRP-like cAMP-binding protein
MKPAKNEAVVALFSRVFPDIAAALGQEDLDRLLDGASLVELAPGRKLMRDRMPVESLYFVLEGSLRAYLEEGGKTLALDRIGPGEWLGEVSVLSGDRTASATVESETPCKLIRIHQVAFERLLTENIRIAGVLLERFIPLMAERFRASIMHGRTPAAN